MPAVRRYLTDFGTNPAYLVTFTFFFYCRNMHIIPVLLMLLNFPAGGNLFSTGGGVFGSLRAQK